ncbi:MAG: cell division protein ZapA [Rhodothermales bacterium]
MSATTHSIRVRILNRDFSLRVSEKDEDLTRDLARYVNDKMQDFLRKHPDQPEITASIIGAMAIAEELFTEREERERLESQLEEAFETMSNRLEQASKAA